MSTRKIIDVKQNGEKVWLKGHAQAIYMSNGSTVEDAINNIDIPSLDGYAKTEDIPSLDGYATEEWINNKNYATEYDLKTIDYSSIKNTPTTEDENGELNITDENGNIGMKVSSEAVYAKDFISGEHKLSEKVNKDYVDNSIAELVDEAPETLNTLNELAAALKDNADIVDVLNQSISSKQDIISDIETIRQGAAKGATALQSYNEQYKGTVTGVKVNGTTKNPSNGVVDLGTVITSHQDISGKQDTLVSGTNIKTINGVSILGDGDIVISTGSESTSVDWENIQNKPQVVTVDASTFTTSDIYNIQRGHVTYKFTPGRLIIDDLTGDDSCSIKGNGDLIFNCNGDGTKFLSDDGTYKGVYTKNEIDAKIGNINTILESIINGGTINNITFTIEGVEHQAEIGMTWKEWLETDYNTYGLYESADGAYIDAGDMQDIVTYVLESVYFVGYSDDSKVKITDEIINNYSYKIINGL